MEQDHRGLNRDEARFVQETKDGGFVIAGTTEDSSGYRESWLVKVSGEPERIENISVASQTETLVASPTQTMRAVPPKTSTIVPPEKTAGFEAVLAISILLAVYSIRGKK